MHAARRLPAAENLQWRRHASSSVSGDRDRFDPEAGDALQLHLADMASGGANAAACGVEFLAGACAGRRRRTAELGLRVRVLPPTRTVEHYM